MAVIAIGVPSNSGSCRLEPWRRFPHQTSFEKADSRTFPRTKRSMSDTDKSSPKDAVKELLLADYATLADALWKNEQSGETRVNWFIGLSTAAAGGLIGLTTAEHRLH